MKTPHYKAKYSRSTSRGWHKALSLVLLLTILAGSFPAGGFTALADEVSDADSMIQQEGAQAEGEGAQLLQAPAPDEAAPESIPYESGTDQSGTDQSGTDQSGTDQSGTDQPGTDESGTDESGTVQPEADQSGTDESGTDQSGAVSQSEQPTEEPAAEPAEEPAEPVAEPTAEPAEAQDEPDEIPAEEETVYANSVSGALWLDILEDENSGAQHGDGIRQAEEEPVPDYDVSLYKADDKDTAVQTVKTDSDGQYIFENLEPGTYVVGISTCEKDGVEYLLPVIGMSDDTQQFSDYNDAYTTVYSKPIAIDTDTVVTGIDAGMRTPPSVQTYAMTEYANNESSLQTAINNVTSGGTIQITGSFSITGIKMIPQNKTITLKSSAGGPYTITQSIVNNGTGRHFEVRGSLILENIVLSGLGNTSGNVNGGVQVNASNASLIMKSGAKITKCHGDPSNGGGVLVSSGTFTMNGGEISNNIAYHGGGVAISGASGNFIMTGGEILENSAERGGGGGGIFLGRDAAFTMTGGKISGNTAHQLGGGLYVFSTSNNTAIAITGGEISGNTAPKGGGICMENSYTNPITNIGGKYRGLRIAGNAVVSGNTATDGTFAPPSNYLDFTNRNPNPFPGTLLDNDNIDYKNPYYAVRYIANNGSSNPDYIPSTGVSIGNTGSVNAVAPTTAGFTGVPGQEKFIKWTTNADGTGTSYQLGALIPINRANVTLYAQWGPYRYRVEKDASGDMIGTYDQLQTAVNACPLNVPCTITATEDDTAMGNMVTIPSGKSITLTSASSNAIRSITQPLSTRHLDVIGKLTLKNIVLKGVGKQTDSSGTVNGGIAVSTGGQLRMEAGAEITKCYTNVTSGAGGAGVNVNGGAFTMTGGKITNNVTPNDGGGVYMLSSTAFVMSGGEISGNKAARGGGVYLFGNGFFIKNGGDITGNTATGHGGGVAMAQGTFISNGGNISGNHANGNGGGVYMSIAQGTFTMGGGTLSGNTAGGDGGAIYTPDYDYDNPADTSKYSRISVSASAVISGNTASGGVFAPPVNHQAFSTRAVKPFPGTLLDNNNINYRGNKYAIAYRVNNTTNTPDAYQATNIATGSSGTATLYTQTQAGFDVASSLEPGKEKFIGWNTQADGQGTHYDANQSIPISDNLTLYAEWDHYRYIVTGDTSGDTIGSYDSLADAVNACRTTEPCTVTATSDDPAVVVTAQITGGKKVTLTSDSPSTRRTITRLTEGNGSLLIFPPSYGGGNLTLKDIALQGTGMTGEGVHILNTQGNQYPYEIKMENGTKISGFEIGVHCSSGRFIMNGGEITGNGSLIAESNYVEGGVLIDYPINHYNDDSTFEMNGGTISGNFGGKGAGVAVSGNHSEFIMNDGEISGNLARSNGGGVYVQGGGNHSFEMNGGKISGNTALGYSPDSSVHGGGGAGVYLKSSGLITGGEISGNNAASGRGGGVYVYGGSSLQMTGGKISGNTAARYYSSPYGYVDGYGGGIFTTNYDDSNPADPNKYRLISISGTAKVQNNTTDGSTCAPPVNYADFSDPAIRGSYTFDGQLLDNDNIVYRNPYYAVAYNANNDGVGTQRYFQTTNVSSGTTTVQAVNMGTGTDEANFTAPAGMSFAGWTENADGTGTLYRPGDPITLTGSKNLYAKWVPFVDVTLSKTVQGDYGDRNKLFEFTITIQDANNTPVTGTLDYTGGIISGSGATAPANGTLTLNSAGSAAVQLKHGQTVTVQGIPSDGKVRVTETAVTSYTTTYKVDSGAPQTDTSTGFVTMNGTNRTIDFVNSWGSVVATGISGGIGQNALPAVTAVLCLTAACCVVIRAVRRRHHG